jgi:predicted ATPase
VCSSDLIRSTITNIKELINQIIPGEFFSDNDGSYYIKNNIKLKTSNLATGSKLFSILKILLLKGEFNDRTLLILDEPESHLHPSWQNKFAEIIVLLIKEMKVTVLLTTHSSEMMLALETYMRKYQINENSNFYQTKMNPETGMVDYVCVNDDLGSIYADFLKYFAEMKALIDKIMFDLGEEDDN